MSEQNENKITATFLSEKENKIKWHHSRWFWGIVVGTLLIWGIIFFDMLYSSSLSRLDVLKNLSFTFGAAPFMIYGQKWIGTFGQISFSIIFYLLLFVLLYKTFYKKYVCILFPIIFSILFLIGSLISILVARI